MTIANQVDAKAVTRRIKSFAKAGVKWQAAAHALAMDCIRLSLPASEGGSLNANSAALFLNAFPKGTRVKAAAAWFRAFSNIVPLLDDKTGQWTCKLTGPALKAYKVVDLAAADARPFWSAEEKSVDPSEFTTDAMAKRVKSILSAATGENAKLDAKGLKALTALRAAAKALGVDA